MRVFIISLWRGAVNHVIRFGIRKTLVSVPIRPAKWILRSLKKRFHANPPSDVTASGFDQRFNVDTRREWLDLVDMASVSSPNWRHGVQYSTLSEDRYRRILDSLLVKYEDFTFIDFGSGKGKSLLVAATYPFKKVIGVEYVERLHRIASKNIAACKHPSRRCRDVESVCADAAGWPIPSEPCIFFFSNPFDETVMQVVVRRVLDSLREFPRQAFVIYCAAYHADVLREHGFREKTEWFAGKGTDLLFECPVRETIAGSYLGDEAKPRPCLSPSSPPRTVDAKAPEGRQKPPSGVSRR